MAESIVALFEETVSAHGGRPAARYKDASGSWHTRTWKEMADDRKEVASGLLALGIEPHERINILANTSYKWMLADMAIQSVAGEPVAIYQSNLPHEVEYIANNCDSVMMFVEDAAQLAKCVQEKEKLTNIKKVIVMDDAADESDWTMTWSELVELGKSKLSDNEAEIEKRIASLGPDDVLTLIYTSGTTGKPKGVVLTHSNLLYEAEACQKIEGFIEVDDVQFLFLPMAHSFARVLHSVWIGVGHEMAIDSDTTKIVDNLAVVRPTMMASVPRIFEKVYAKVVSGGLEAGGVKAKMFQFALDANDGYAQHMQENKPIPFGLQLKLNIAKSLVFSKINERLSGLFGGRLRFFVSGGAPLSKKIAYFFANADVKILEGYGLTETSAATVVNRVHQNKIGTVGKPVDGTEIKIASDGEILIKGPGVMREYYKREEATKEVLSPDGWFSTGDIGEIDADGFLKITDRKKDIIVTAGGKNVAPQNIEGMIKAASPVVSQVMVYGDKRKYLSALITMSPETIDGWASDNGLSGDYKALTQKPEARTFIQGVINKVNSDLASYETIKKFAILEADFEIGDELTPTLKVKRKHATQKYMSILETMYDEPIQQ